MRKRAQFIVWDVADQNGVLITLLATFQQGERNTCENQSAEAKSPLSDVHGD